MNYQEQLLDAIDFGNQLQHEAMVTDKDRYKNHQEYQHNLVELMVRQTQAMESIANSLADISNRPYLNANK